MYQQKTMSFTKTKFIAAVRKRNWEKIERSLDDNPKPVMSIAEIITCIDEIRSKEVDGRLFGEDLITYRILGRFLQNYYHPDSVAQMLIDKNDIETIPYAVSGKISPEIYEYAAKKGRFFALMCISGRSSYIKTRDVLMGYNFVRDDKYPRDSFMIALRTFDYKFIKKILDDNPDLANEDDDFAICYACEYGNVKMVKLLLGYKNVDPAINENFPIKIAMTHQHYSVVLELLKHPAVSVNEIDLNVVKLVIEKDHVCVAERILNEGYDHIVAYFKRRDSICEMLEQNNNVMLSAIRNGIIEKIPHDVKLPSDVARKVKKEIKKCESGDYEKAYEQRSYQENIAL